MVVELLVGSVLSVVCMLLWWIVSDSCLIGELSLKW